MSRENDEAVIAELRRATRVTEPATEQHMQWLIAKVLLIVVDRVWPLAGREEQQRFARSDSSG